MSLYFLYIFLREGTIVLPPHLLFSLTLLPSPEQTGCVRVCQGIWNNVKVNKTHSKTRTHTGSQDVRVENENNNVSETESVQPESLENEQYTKSPTWRWNKINIVVIWKDAKYFFPVSCCNRRRAPNRPRARLELPTLLALAHTTLLVYVKLIFDALGVIA